MFTRIVMNRRMGQHCVIAASLLPLLGIVSAPLSASIRGPRMGVTWQSLSAPRKPGFEAGKSNIQGQAISLDVEFEMRPGDSGLLVVGGDDAETFAVYVQAGRVVWAYQNIFQDKAVSIPSGTLPEGVLKVRFELVPEQQGGGIDRCRIGSLFVNGTLVGRSSPIEYSVPLEGASASRLGASAGEQLENIIPPYSFTGKIRKVTPHRGAY